MTLAFEGIKVLDFTQVISGPVATYQLALLGAEVIKVEEPRQGDMCRALLDHGAFGAGLLSPAFIGLNLNKRSIAMDLKHGDARHVLEPLVRDADVVIENFRPGVIARLGFDYEAVKAIRSDVVYCSISGYGQTGPKAGNPAFDGAIQAASGMMSANGHEQTGPTRTVSPVVDVSTGMMAAFAIAAALHRRQVTGEGQYLDVAMLDTAVSLLNPVFNVFLATGVEPELLGNQSIVKSPTTDVFPSSDGHVQITALTDQQAEKLCAALGCSHLLEDPLFATREARIEHRSAMRECLIAITREAPTAEWVRRLGEAGVPAAPIATFPEVMNDTQLEHRGLTAELEPHGSVKAGSVTSITTGFIASTDGPRANATAPMLGEHTQTVLREYGYSEAAISDMVEAGLIPAAPGASASPA